MQFNVDRIMFPCNPYRCLVSKLYVGYAKMLKYIRIINEIIFRDPGPHPIAAPASAILYKISLIHEAAPPRMQYVVRV